MFIVYNVKLCKNAIYMINETITIYYKLAAVSMNNDLKGLETAAKDGK